MSSYKSRGGVRRLGRALCFSWQGLKAAWRSEAAFRQECVVLVVLLPSAFWLGRTALEIFVLCLSLILILVVELINSAIEALADSISLEHQPLLGQAKDMASAAVLLTILGALGWWVWVVFDRFLN